MEGMTYLALGYFGMLVAIALWTYTVVQRSRRLEDRLAALESVASPPAASDGANNELDPN